MHDLHKGFFITCLLGGLFLSGLAFLPVSCYAVNLPDAGRLQKELEQTLPIPQLSTIPEIPIEQPASLLPQKSVPKLTVKSFILAGNQQISTAELQPLLDKYTGKMIQFSDLQNLANGITSTYQAHGYLTSRAYLPAQDIADGVVQISILEGRLASPGFSVQGTDKVRLKKNRVLALLNSAMTEGQILKKSELERGMLLVGDLPGITAKSTLVPGASVGTSELLVEANEDSLLTGSVETDNYGGRYTGNFRGGGSLQLNNPTRVGDLAGLKLLSSGEGLNYLRGFYQRPVGFSGTSLGASLAWMNYSLGEEFKDDDIKGDSLIASVYLTHPVIRSREQNLYMSGNLDIKRLTDETAGITTKERDISVLKISLTGNQIDHLYNSGVTDFGVTLSAGKFDLSGVIDALATDAASARTDGNFYLLSGNISHTRYLPHNLSLFTGFQGQIPFGNLDSSEKLSLGGPASVRAYPQGEANGDAGYILNAELRRDFNQILPNHQLQTSLFIDHGRIWLHHDTWAGWQGSNPALENSYALSGTGIGAVLSKSGHYFVRASYGWALGNNKGRDTNGNNSEGKDSNGQFWLQAAYWF